MTSNSTHRPPLVLVTSDNNHWDLSDLTRFGEVVKVAHTRAIYPDNVDEMSAVLGRHAYDLARAFNPVRDHIALVGDPLACVIVTSQIFAMHLRVSVLKYDKQAQRYYQTWIRIPDMGAMEYAKANQKAVPEASAGRLEV